MKNKFLRAIGICVLVTTIIDSAWGLDYYEIGGIIKNKKLNDLMDCAGKNNNICQMELGFAYMYGSKLKDTTLVKDINAAEIFLTQSMLHPYSRYLLGRIKLTTQNKAKAGASLIQSSCVDGEENACVMIASLYSENRKEHDKRNLYPLFEENTKQAIFYTQRAIHLAEDKLKKQGIPLEKRYFVQNNLKSYKIKLAYLFIEEKNPKGVELLEATTFDDNDFGGNPLALIYEEGKIIPQNLVKSYMYYDLMGGPANIEDKKRLEKIMTPMQIKEALECSWKWQEDHHSYRSGFRDSNRYDIKYNIYYK